MTKKRIVFLTGTRADFGKMKSLMRISQDSGRFDVHIFVTGMHMSSKYGKTVDEIFKASFKNIFQFINHDTISNMDRTLAKTIDGFSHYVAEIQPDLIIVHGDRVEALAGAIVGSINNILVAHIEGGELSGTIDELIRHAVSKMAHIHFVANVEAYNRLVQLGELKSSIYIIGSPDLDLMNPDTLPDINMVKKHYGIDLEEFAIAIFHPVTTEYNYVREHVEFFVDALIESNKAYVVIFPNNDLGSNEILDEYKRLEGNQKFLIFPSLRFEYFLTLLRHSKFIIGNSSAGIREAAYYKVPTVDIGSRQNNRSSFASIIHSVNDTASILNAISNVETMDLSFDEFNRNYFGQGESGKLFMETITTQQFWDINLQKQFQGLVLSSAN